MNPTFEVWKSIRLGTGLKTRSDFFTAFNEAKFKVGGYVNGILRDRHFSVSDSEVFVQLVNISVEELGFSGPAKRAEIYAQAFERGLKLCPAEVGPQLRLQYLDQPHGEWLTIGMEPILNDDGDPSVFFVAHSHGKLLLSGDYGYYDLSYNPEKRFIFVC
jgi:hypothetical protein